MSQRWRVAGSGQRIDGVVETLELNWVNSGSPATSPSATARWVQRRAERKRTGLADGISQPDASSGSAPTRCIPVSTLRWTSTAAASGGSRFGQLSQPGRL